MEAATGCAAHVIDNAGSFRPSTAVRRGAPRLVMPQPRYNLTSLPSLEMFELEKAFDAQLDCIAPCGNNAPTSTSGLSLGSSGGTELASADFHVAALWAPARGSRNSVRYFHKGRRRPRAGLQLACP